ncbi:hypothetical protein BFW38_05705 [Terasakiispira papahanaumokuakeensis]|uniref:DUF600 domain-containing protein n=1 Tax=Terasakiispira papahanaumokuakeensis TaxID=197479 RepID=A0A1E2V8Y0_9GAMM|nr:hypothetical protein [Terasakiispira papahanaumokuakeensis]ODC03115.1 hypothetical protein BFW38_05705 [Terasakiispira papahanaumokuakeensis]
MNYSKDELMQCICESMADSLPSNWQSAYMQASISGNELDANFRYTDSETETEKPFQPDNCIAPMNAAKELQALMKAEGNTWNTVTVRITSDGKFEVFTQ